jgi:glycosyltransferase involved in cell wall biosynthesis
LFLIFTIFLIGYTVLGCVYWLLQFVFAVQTITKVRPVKDLAFEERPEWPRVSVIVPACNEEKFIAQAVKSRLQEDYPNLELVLVDDRSTDRTSAIIDQLASEDTRVKVLHITDVPDGWLGKVYAMQRGAEIASGGWLLFSDADVFVKPGTLKQVIAYAESKNLDHIPVLPELYPTGFLVDICLSIFIRQICLFGRVWEIEDERSDAAGGAGAFNLVRRRAFDQAEGFARMKLFVADDIGLGQVLKKTGAKSAMLNGRNRIGVYFYHSVHDMAVGSERALFTFIGKFSLMRLIMIALLMVGMEIAPFVMAIHFGVPYIPAVGWVMSALAIGISIALNVWAHRPLYTAFFIPLGICIMAACVVRAGILGKRRGGIVWRGTFYPTELLKTGTDIK